MDNLKELKLMIYESSLDVCDKEDLLTIVESTDDEEILSEVFDILEDSRADSIKTFSSVKQKDIKTTGREIKEKISDAKRIINNKEDDISKINRDIKDTIKYWKDQNDPFEYLNNKYDLDGKSYNSKLKSQREEITSQIKKLRSEINKHEQDRVNLKTKSVILNDMKTKYKNNPDKMKQVRDIREKHGHKLESVLEAFKEGILTESEILELFEASKDEIDYIATQGSFERMNKNTNAMMKNVDKIISGEYKEKKLSKEEKRKRDLKEGYKTLHNDEMYKKLFKDK